MKKEQFEAEMQRIEKINEKYEKERQKKISRLLFKLKIKKLFTKNV